MRRGRGREPQSPNPSATSSEPHIPEHTEMDEMRHMLEQLTPVLVQQPPMQEQAPPDQERRPRHEVTPEDAHMTRFRRFLEICVTSYADVLHIARLAEQGEAVEARSTSPRRAARPPSVPTHQATAVTQIRTPARVAPVSAPAATGTTCVTCGHLHGGRPCYVKTRACFRCGALGHFVRDCPLTRRVPTEARSASSSRAVYPPLVPARPSASPVGALAPIRTVSTPAPITITTACATCGRVHGGRRCYVRSGACFRCGGIGHFMRDCPINQGVTATLPRPPPSRPSVQIPPAKRQATAAHVYALGGNQPVEDADAVRGTVHINRFSICVMFNIGATHSLTSWNS